MKKYKVILTESEMRKLNEMNIDTNSSGFRFKDKNGKPGYAAQVLMFLNDRPDGSTKNEMVFAGIDIYGMSAGVLTKLRKAGLITLNGSVWTITDEGIEVAESLGSWTDNRSERQNAIFEAKKYRNRCIKLFKDYFEDIQLRWNKKRVCKKGSNYLPPHWMYFHSMALMVRASMKLPKLQKCINPIFFIIMKIKKHCM